eukprot:TRINITY_DN6559_c0_g1_i1.p1 TRINITY_DN6559_c0_g1~~TRINITY_DN6559_c0_g1_i1.p1  ORF type:complete len:224 (+),score=37.15 TRINITY_DN6559_c0_g1_i1:370-1041(+)
MMRWFLFSLTLCFRCTFQLKKNEVIRQGEFSKKYPFNGLQTITFYLWINTYTWSTLFHIHENKLTESMDYYSAMIGWSVMSYASILRVFDVRSTNAMAMIAIPFVLRVLYFLYYMTFVVFDYGWTIECVGQFVVLHCILTVPWSIKRLITTQQRHYLLVPLTHLLIVIFLPLELYDFKPVLGHFDGHSLWHGAGVLILYTWTSFINADVKHYQPTITDVFKSF